MKFALLSLVLFAALTSRAEESKEKYGKALTALPKQIQVLDQKGQIETYNYLPGGQVGNNVSIYDGKWLRVEGDMSSMCMNHDLGTLANPLEFDIQMTDSKEKLKFEAPAGTPVQSTCPPGEHDAMDLTFKVEAPATLVKAK